MKTPDGVTDISVGCKALDETKHWLEYCHSAKACADCSYDKRDFPHCVRRLLGDAINGYQHLESRLAQVERERDAAVADINEASNVLCHVCKHDAWPNCRKGRNNLFDDEVACCEFFEWRGVCEENTKEEKQ